MRLIRGNPQVGQRAACDWCELHASPSEPRPVAADLTAVPMFMTGYRFCAISRARIVTFRVMLIVGPHTAVSLMLIVTVSINTSDIEASANASRNSSAVRVTRVPGESSLHSCSSAAAANTHATTKLYTQDNADNVARRIRASGLLKRQTTVSCLRPSSRCMYDRMLMMSSCDRAMSKSSRRHHRTGVRKRGAFQIRWYGLRPTNWQSTSTDRHVHVLIVRAAARSLRYFARLQVTRGLLRRAGPSAVFSDLGGFGANFCAADCLLSCRLQAHSAFRSGLSTH